MELRYVLTDGDSQACIGDTGNRAEDCSEVSMVCDAVLSIRIVPPGDPRTPYLSMCVPLITQKNLCAISFVDLAQPTVPVPRQILEVQMAVFPKSAVQTDPITGALICPLVDYGANNLPVSAKPNCSDNDTTCPVVPAIGGRTLYYPGDSETVVKLGCTDLEQLQKRSCADENVIDVTASVADFTTGFPVSTSVAQRLVVGVGDPVPVGDSFELNQPRELMLRTGSSPPAWSGMVDTTFTTATCLDVREDAAQSTSAVTCQPVPSMLGDNLDMTGYRLPKATLDQILTALGKTAFPDQGLVVGIVVDHVNMPQSGITVVPTSGTIQYLSNDLSTVVTGGTSASGVFVSQDATFGTMFSAQSSNFAEVSAYGGLVDGKVTVVVIRFKPPSTGG